MKVGAEPKKVALLAGLLLLAVYFYFSGRDTGGGESTERQSAASPAVSSPLPAASVTQAETPTIRSTRGPTRTSDQGGIQEFRPSLSTAREEDRPDPMTIDPTLRLDLLNKLQAVKVDNISRSLFEFGSPPLPPEPKIVPVKQTEASNTPERSATPPKPVKSPPPAIPLKFYGYIDPARTGPKRAFFLEGEDIFVAGEGDLIRNRYKVVSIGVNSAVLEDTEHDNEQTLRLEEQVG